MAHDISGHPPHLGQRFSAFLFDMDGTLITSTASAERVWSRWLINHGLDPELVLPQIHGVQSIDSFRRLNVPGVDPQEAADWIMREEILDLEGITPIEGAVDFVAALPADRWAIVTSARRPLAEARLKAAAIQPPMLITPEDYKAGKPAPDGFLFGARALGFEARDCLVFEDAPAGIEAGRAAGASVLVIGATHKHPPVTSWPVINDYRGLVPVLDGDRLIIEAVQPES